MIYTNVENYVHNIKIFHGCITYLLTLSSANMHTTAVAGQIKLVRLIPLKNGLRKVDQVVAFNYALTDPN